MIAYDEIPTFHTDGNRIIISKSSNFELQFVIKVAKGIKNNPSDSKITISNFFDKYTGSSVKCEFT